MFFRGAQFQRDGHARCNLLLSHTLLSNSADLSPVGLRALRGTIHCARVAAHNRKRQKLHSCSDRYLFDATQSIFLGIGPVMRLCHRLQLAPSRSPHFEWSLVEALVADQPPPRVTVRHSAGEKRQTSCRQGAYTKDSCGFARVSDLCLRSIGESCSVSWRWWRPSSSAWTFCTPSQRGRPR